MKQHKALSGNARERMTRRIEKKKKGLVVGDCKA